MSSSVNRDASAYTQSVIVDRSLARIYHHYLVAGTEHSLTAFFGLQTLTECQQQNNGEGAPGKSRESLRKPEVSGFVDPGKIQQAICAT